MFIDSRATLRFSADLSAPLQRNCDPNLTIKNAKMRFLLSLETLEFDIMKSPEHALSKNVAHHLPYMGYVGIQFLGAQRTSDFVCKRNIETFFGRQCPLLSTSIFVFSNP